MAGDILDGYHPNAESEAALDALLKVFDALEKPHWHMIGNHCLYNLPREVGLPRHNISSTITCVQCSTVLHANRQNMAGQKDVRHSW